MEKFLRFSISLPHGHCRSVHQSPRPGDSSRKHRVPGMWLPFIILYICKTGLQSRYLHRTCPILRFARSARCYQTRLVRVCRLLKIFMPPEACPIQVAIATGTSRCNSAEGCRTKLWLKANKQDRMAIEPKAQARDRRLLKGGFYLWSALLLVHGACQHCRM